MRLQVKVDAIVPRNGHADNDHTEVEHRAERLLAEYLRMWGLRDPSTIAAHCRLWARQAVVDDDRAANRTRSVSYRSAVEQAMHDIGLWLDHLTRLTSADPQAAPLRRGLLAIELQTLIDKHPTVMLAYETLPPALAQRLQRASRPVVPFARPTHMPAQPLGELAGPLRFDWWQQAIVNLFATPLRMLRFRWFG
jgi:hypothetical protein